MAKQQPSLLSFLLKLRPVIRWILKLRSSPKSIAGGLALGTFLAFTPTYGVQMFLAIVLATLLGFNRPAAIIPVWITNPVTIAPVYTFNYWVGCFLWSGPPVSEVSSVIGNLVKKLTSLEIWDMGEQILAVLHTSQEILIPLTIGSCIVGTILGLVIYGVSLPLLTFVLKRRKRKTEVSQ